MLTHGYEDSYYLSNEDYLYDDCHTITGQNLLKNEDIKSLKKNLIQGNKQNKQVQAKGNQSPNSSSYYEGKSANSGEEKGNGKRTGKWTKEEDDILTHLVPMYGGKNWKKVAESIKGRSPIQCLHRWTKILQPGLVKGPWTIEEDRKLLEWVKKEGPNRWSQCAEYIKGRNGKQCRERWFNTLNPNVKKGNWSPEEDYKTFILFKKFGGKWSKIAVFFEGRTENSIKNRFYSTLRRISAEKKKENGIEKNDNDMTHITSSLDELQKYIPLAFTESKIRFMKINNYSNDDLQRYDNYLTNIEKTTSNKPKSKLSDKQFNFENNSVSTPCVFQTEKPKENTTLNSNSNPNTTYNHNVKINTTNNNNYFLNSNNNTHQFDNNTNLFDNNNLNNNHSVYKNMDLYSLENQIIDMCDNSSLFFADSNFNMGDQLDNMIENMFEKNNIFITSDENLNCNVCDEGLVNNNNTNTNMNNILGAKNYASNDHAVNTKNTSNNNAITTGTGSGMNTNEEKNSNNIISNSINALNLGCFPTTTNDLWQIKCEQGETKKDALNALIKQLNEIEQAVKVTKKELLRLESTQNLEKENNLTGNIENLFKF